jgi:hypothetical protein
MKVVDLFETFLQSAHMHCFVEWNLSYYSEVGVQLDLGVIFSIISCNSNLCSIFGEPTCQI